MPSVYAYHREVENAWLVRQRDRRRQRELALVVLVALPVVAALIGYTWLHVRMLHSAYRLQELAAELAEAERLRGSLAVEAAGLAALGEVERRAAAELGMTEQSVETTWTLQEVMAEPVLPAPEPVGLAPVTTGALQSAPLQSAPLHSAPAQSAPLPVTPTQPAPTQPAPMEPPAMQPAPMQIGPLPPLPPEAAPRSVQPPAGAEPPAAVDPPSPEAVP